MMENWLKSQLIKDPESVFEQPSLSYKCYEIDAICERFDRAEHPIEVHGWVRQLLYATADFRRATEPNPILKRLRTETKTDAELKETFTHMESALVHAYKRLEVLSNEDKRILMAAINYSKKSIRERMQSLDPNDRLFPFWESSKLKENFS